MRRSTPPEQGSGFKETHVADSRSPEEIRAATPARRGAQFRKSGRRDATPAQSVARDRGADRHRRCGGLVADAAFAARRATRGTVANSTDAAHTATQPPPIKRACARRPHLPPPTSRCDRTAAPSASLAGKTRWRRRQPGTHDAAACTSGTGRASTKPRRDGARVSRRPLSPTNRRGLRTTAPPPAEAMQKPPAQKARRDRAACSASERSNPPRRQQRRPSPSARRGVADDLGIAVLDTQGSARARSQHARLFRRSEAAFRRDQRRSQDRRRRGRKDLILREIRPDGLVLEYRASGSSFRGPAASAPEHVRPLEQRRKPRPPWATLLIVASCVVVFLWLATLPLAERLTVINRWGTVPSTLLDPNAPWLQQLAELRAARLVTALFIHADWLHLTGNLLFLIVFGVSAERALGSSPFSRAVRARRRARQSRRRTDARRDQRADRRIERRGVGGRRRVSRAVSARAARPRAAARSLSRIRAHSGAAADRLLGRAAASFHLSSARRSAQSRGGRISPGS